MGGVRGRGLLTARLSRASLTWVRGRGGGEELGDVGEREEGAHWCKGKRRRGSCHSGSQNDAIERKKSKLTKQSVRTRVSNQLPLPPQTIPQYSAVSVSLESGGVVV